ncbi:hypothetical protein J6590_017659 [Homalodisca vitripennis]|nr:hypothetical protein J6590_017659 [Homalodisca vitripennis]
MEQFSSRTLVTDVYPKELAAAIYVVLPILFRLYVCRLISILTYHNVRSANLDEDDLFPDEPRDNFQCLPVGGLEVPLVVVYETNNGDDDRVVKIYQFRKDLQWNLHISSRISRWMYSGKIDKINRSRTLGVVVKGRLDGN